MAPIIGSVVLIMTLISVLRLAPALGFSGDFEIANLFVDCPFQADPTSTVDCVVSFDFADEDTPDCPWVHCCVEWKVGLTPPSIPAPGYCSNDSVKISFPTGSYYGVANLTLALSHAYEDDSIGRAPYNTLTKFGNLNLTYGITPDYECDIERAYCESEDGAVLIVEITSAVA